MPEEHLDFAPPADLGRLRDLGAVRTSDLRLMAQQEGDESAEALKRDEADVG